MWDVKASRYQKKRPGSAFARFVAGWTGLMWGNAPKAESCFDEALAVDSGYAPACIGKICVDIFRGRFYRAVMTLFQYSDRLRLNRYVGRFRLCCAVSACALMLIKGRSGDLSESRGVFAPLRYFLLDRKWRRLWAEDPTVAGVAHLPYLKLIRYIELLRRDLAAPRAGRSGGGAGKYAAERAALAGDIYRLPGLLDEFRLFLLDETERGAAVGMDFTFDMPALFTKAFLNEYFREKIFLGELREPRIILSNLRRDASAQKIDNVNKWLFLKLSAAARRRGRLETRTARELEADGWWADPVVRAYLM